MKCLVVSRKAQFDCDLDPRETHQIEANGKKQRLGYTSHQHERARQGTGVRRRKEKEELEK